MQKAAAYARFSSSNQREESIEAQLREIRKYATDNDLVIVKEYTDMAESATTADRPQFQQLLQDAKKVNFEVVLVHKLDRFARNRYDAAVTRHEFKELNIKMISVLERIDDGPESILLESLLDGLNEYYSANLARETMKGLLENAHQALFNGGRAPLGFDIKDKRYVINEYEAEAVRMIFNLVEQNYTYGQIIKKLSYLGYRTKKGAEFKKSSIHDILVNEKYMGNYIFNKSSRRNNGKRNNRKKKEDGSVISIPGAIPAIIPDVQFTRIQEILASRKKLKNRNETRATEPFVLSGIIYCGHCGSRMNGDTRNNGFRNYKYYVCSNRSCKQPSVPKKVIEEGVSEKLIKGLFKPEKAERYAEKMNSFVKNNRSSIYNQIKDLKKQKQDNDSKIENLLSAVEQGCDMNIIKPRINELSEKRKNLQFRAEALERQASRSLIKSGTLKEFLKDQTKLVKSCNEEQKQKLCQKFIKNITVKDDNVRIKAYLNMSSQQNCVDHDGVGDGNRTHMVLTTRPSTVRVCLFRHPDNNSSEAINLILQYIV